MDSAGPLDIKVVYSASSRGPRRTRSITRRTSRRPVVGLLLGLCSILVAGGLSYVSWWRVDREIYLIFMMKTPVPGLDPNASASLFSTTPRSLSGKRAARPVEPREDVPRFVGKTATEVIGITAYAWLALSSMASCALALSAGAIWAMGAGRRIKRTGLILFVLGTIAVVGAGYGVWVKYGRWYPPNDLRMAMGTLVVLFLFLGLSIGRAGRGLSRVAAVTLILSAAGSAVALYLGGQCGAISAEQSSLTVVAVVFAGQSLYGWLLFPGASRLIR